VVDANGGTPTQITSGGADFIEEPAWSPDGGEIAFVRGDARGTGLFLVHQDGTGLRKLSDIVGGGYDAPAWSPDGTAIAFSTAVYRKSYSARGREIFIVNADGSGQQRLTEGAPRDWIDSAPIWSPDGAQILFDRYRDRQRPYTMNVDGTCERKLVPDLDEGWSASWQPIPGGPSGGPKQCHALSVEAVIEESTGRITATVGNEGTEQLTDVVLLARGATDVSLTSGQVESQGGRCLARSGSVTCRLPRLDRGERLVVTIVVESRRVTYVNDPKPAGIVALRTPISVSASQSLLETGRESDLLWYMLVFCTTRTAGGGVIRGTIYADHICGRKGADRILPGGGRDSVEAGAGPDIVLSAGDRRRDSISCGSGRDRVIADRRDRVARNCERVSRRR
jgi:dipeptidyl aminopeptidase/acylaminoacyl peptidase